MVKMTRKATITPTDKPMAPARYMGGHGQQNAPEGFLEPSKDKEISTTKNVFVPGMFSGYSQRFVPRVSEGNENNGINPGSEADMGKPPENSELHKYPDGFLIGDRVVDGVEGSIFLALSAPARQLVIANGYKYLEVTVLIQLIPQGNNSASVSILESQEAEISCV